MLALLQIKPPQDSTPHKQVMNCRIDKIQFVVALESSKSIYFKMNMVVIMDHNTRIQRLKYNERCV